MQEENQYFPCWWELKIDLQSNLTKNALFDHLSLSFMIMLKRFQFSTNVVSLQRFHTNIGKIMFIFSRLPHSIFCVEQNCDSPSPPHFLLQFCSWIIGPFLSTGKMLASAFENRIMPYISWSPRWFSLGIPLSWTLFNTIIFRFLLAMNRLVWRDSHTAFCVASYVWLT